MFTLSEEICAEEENVAIATRDEGNSSEVKEKRDSKEIIEQRHHRLMHLLEKSKLYSHFLREKIETGQKQLNKEWDKEDHSSNSQRIKEMAKKGQRHCKAFKRKAYEVNNNANRKEDCTSKSCLEDQLCESYNSVSPPLLFEGGEMRPYQLEGYAWLKILFENGINGILADEMGLGKTVQCIAFLCYLIEMSVPGPFLVVAPLSTLPNWILEINRFSPKIPCILYHGLECVRVDLRKNIQKPSHIDLCNASACPVVITSYEIAVRDLKYLAPINWRSLIIDEGHRIKNSNCKLIKCLRMYNTTSRLLLTGTPLQNNLSELWSLLNFLMPEIFDSLEVFESWFNISDMMHVDCDERIIRQEQENQIISTLHQAFSVIAEICLQIFRLLENQAAVKDILRPFLLRREKRDIDIQIPLKRELLVYTPMTENQLYLYEATITKDLSAFEDKKVEEIQYDEKGRPKRKAKFEGNFSFCFNNSETDDAVTQYFDTLAKPEPEDVKLPVISKSKVIVKLQNIMMQCRKIVNHPYLVQYPLDDDGNFKIDENLTSSSGKLLVLDQLLHELYARGHKVLLFSQMTKMLDIIEDYLLLKQKFKYKRLDGNVKLEDRHQDIIEFNGNNDYFLYLLSTRAGGLGVNLTSADTVIIYDSDWNPQQDLQAQDRCHRIGQTKPVLILRLVTAASVDEKIVERAASKRKLEKIIINSGSFSSSKLQNGFKYISGDELLEMLNQRDHEKIHKANSGYVFSKEELDQILDRSDLYCGKNTSSNKCKVLQGVYKVISGNNAE